MLGVASGALALSNGAGAQPLGAEARTDGVLRGQVASKTDARPIAGAVISIGNFGATATTGSDGTFSIPGLAPGKYHVRVAVGGATVADSDVLITAGGITRQNFAPAGAAVAIARGETIQVFGRRNPAAKARLKQFTALNSVNVQSAQEIAKYPDVSTAEALSRVPGISLETDTGEGRFVNIRGIDADLNGYTFGGVVLPASSPASPFGGGRAVAFDAIPAGFVGQIEVTKTLRPDQDAQGLGGQIEISPKSVSAGDPFFVEGQVGTGIELLRNKTIAQGDLTVGGSFGLDRSPFDAGYKPFTLLLTGDFYNDSRAVDDVEESYTDQQSAGVPSKVFSALELRRYDSYHRDRYGYGGEFTFQPNVDNRWYIRYAESGYTEQVDRQRLIYSNLDNSAGLTDASGNPYPVYVANPASPGGFIAPASQLETTLRDEGETLRDKVATTGGDNNFGDYTLDYHVAWAEGSYNKGHDFNSTFTTAPVSVAYNNVNSTYPSVAVQTPGFNYLDPHNYLLSSLINQSQQNADIEYSGGADLSRPVDLAGGDGVLKIGGLIRERTRSVNQQNQSYSINPSTPLTLANLDAGGHNNVFYNNTYTIPPGPNSDQVRGLVGTNVLIDSVSADLLANQLAQEHDTENVYAAYFQYAWHSGPWGVLAGIRFERTEAGYGAYGSNVDAAGNTVVTPFRVNSVQYNDYFPTVQGRYEITPTLIARLAYSTGIARPGFNQISGATNIDIGAETVTGGNPKLVPITLDNFEGSIAWYTPHAGILSVGAFDKQLHNYIYPSSTRGPIAGFPGLTFTTIGYANGGEGRATGVEFDYHQKFDYVPPVLYGLGVDVNYTYVSSQGSVHPGVQTVLPSTAPHTLNASVFYENYGIEARLAYDFVGQNLFAVGSSTATDIFSQPRGTLDLATQYQFSNHFKYYFNAKNLLNTPLKFVEGGADNRPIQREFYDLTLQTGIKFDF